MPNPSDENRAYERLAQEIYEALLRSEGIESVSVEHDIKLQGESGCEHQIDVYWKFKVADETHEIAIECKNYSSHVSIGAIRDFFGVITDIGNIKGIFVTKLGYQKGAKKFAQFYGIALKEIRFPDEQDWEGRIRAGILNLHLANISVSQLDIRIDTKYPLNENVEDEIVNISVEGAKKILLLDSNNDLISSLYHLECKLPVGFEPKENCQHKYEFEDAFLHLPDRDPIKIRSLDYTYDYTLETESHRFEGEEIVKAIIKDVKSGDIKFVSKDGEVF